MANQEHCDLLKQGVGLWNAWREKHHDIRPDLIGANLIGANLIGVDLIEADLSGANLIGANLIGANLIEADLSRADLSRANLSGANLNGADLIHADFGYADLSRANLSRANLSYADFWRTKVHNPWKTDYSTTSLSGAELSEANLSYANLDEVDLSGANLIGATLSHTTLSHADLNHTNLDYANLINANLTNTRFQGTVFAHIDLNLVKGLHTAIHYGPSNVDINSVTLPTDENTRLHFLHGVGFTETQIAYLLSLFTRRPIQYYSLFISYAHQDEEIAKRLYTDLLKNDVPCWFAPEDMKIGDKLRHSIDESIRLHNKFLLILSEHSVASQWVEHEVETALGKEGEGNPNVLFPIRLDNAVMKSTIGWASHIRLIRHIGDFTNWQDDSAYQRAFARLLRDLKVNTPPMK